MGFSIKGLARTNTTLTMSRWTALFFGGLQSARQTGPGMGPWTQEASFSPELALLCGVL